VLSVRNVEYWSTGVLEYLFGPYIQDGGDGHFHFKMRGGREEYGLGPVEAVFGRIIGPRYQGEGEVLVHHEGRWSAWEDIVLRAMGRRGSRGV
jgi:hypothetical protein